MKNFTPFSIGLILIIVFFLSADTVNAQTYYSKPNPALMRITTLHCKSFKMDGVKEPILCAFEACSRAGSLP